MIKRSSRGFNEWNRDHRVFPATKTMTGRLGSSENGRFTLWSGGACHYFTCSIEITVHAQDLEVTYVRVLATDHVSNRKYVRKRAIAIKTINPYEDRQNAQDEQVQRRDPVHGRG